MRRTWILSAGGVVDVGQGLLSSVKNAWATVHEDCGCSIAAGPGLIWKRTADRGTYHLPGPRGDPRGRAHC